MKIINLICSFISEYYVNIKIMLNSDHSNYIAYIQTAHETDYAKRLWQNCINNYLLSVVCYLNYSKSIYLPSSLMAKF